MAAQGPLLGQPGRMALAFSEAQEAGMSVDGLQNVSLGVPVMDQEAAGRSPNSLPLPSRDASTGSACRTGSIGFS